MSLPINGAISDGSKALRIPWSVNRRLSAKHTVRHQRRPFQPVPPVLVVSASVASNWPKHDPGGINASTVAWILAMSTTLVQQGSENISPGNSPCQSLNAFGRHTMDPPSKGIWRLMKSDEIWWNLMNNKHQTNINKNQTTLDLLASYGWINIGSMHYGMLYFNIFYIYIVSTYLYI